MKRAAGLVLILVLFAQVSFAMPGNGDLAPDFDWVSSNGTKTSLSDLRGQVVIIEFFAVWCSPCRQLSTFLVDLGKRSRVKIIGLNVEDWKAEQTAEYVRKKGIPYPVVYANEQIQKIYGVKSLPLLYIIGKDGKIIASFNGYNRDVARSIEQIVSVTR